MKIGNIQKIVKDFAEKYKDIMYGEKQIAQNFERDVRRLPMIHLEEFFQKRFNKNIDYDQWVGIREELESMGYKLYEKALAMIGDAIMVIQSENQERINELEMLLRDANEEKERLQKELKKYVD